MSNKNQDPRKANPDFPIYNGKNACKIYKDLSDKVIVITGSSNGVGKSTARLLAFMGPTIIFACRDEAKTLPVIQEIQQETKNKKLEFIRLDLSDLQSVRDFAKEFNSRHKKLDILINNAGINMPDRRKTKDGFELVFGTNHLGHFYLTELLIDALKRAAPSRILNVSSGLHESAKMKWDDLMFEKNFSMLDSYKQSKLANVMFTKELQRRVAKDNIKVVCLCPGLIGTDLNRDLKTSKWYHRLMVWALKPFQKSLLEGGQNSLYCALEDAEKLDDGGYYRDCKRAKENPLSKDEANCKRLWDISEKLISEKIKN